MVSMDMKKMVQENIKQFEKSKSLCHWKSVGYKSSKRCVLQAERGRECCEQTGLKVKSEKTQEDNLAAHHWEKSYLFEF